MAVRKRGHKGDGKTRCLGGCWDSFPSCFFFFILLQMGRSSPRVHISLYSHTVSNTPSPRMP